MRKILAASCNDARIPVCELIETRQGLLGESDYTKYYICFIKALLTKANINVIHPDLFNALFFPEGFTENHLRHFNSSTSVVQPQAADSFFEKKYLEPLFKLTSPLIFDTAKVAFETTLQVPKTYSWQRVAKNLDLLCQEPLVNTFEGLLPSHTLYLTALLSHRRESLLWSNNCVTKEEGVHLNSETWILGDYHNYSLFFNTPSDPATTVLGHQGDYKAQRELHNYLLEIQMNNIPPIEQPPVRNDFRVGIIPLFPTADGVKVGVHIPKDPKGCFNGYSYKSIEFSCGRVTLEEGDYLTPEKLLQTGLKVLSDKFGIVGKADTIKFLCDEQTNYEAIRYFTVQVYHANFAWEKSDYRKKHRKELGIIDAINTTLKTPKDLEHYAMRFQDETYKISDVNETQNGGWVQKAAQGFREKVIFSFTASNKKSGDKITVQYCTALNKFYIKIEDLKIKDFNNAIQVINREREYVEEHNKTEGVVITGVENLSRLFSINGLDELKRNVPDMVVLAHLRRFLAKNNNTTSEINYELCKAAQFADFGAFMSATHQDIEQKYQYHCADKTRFLHEYHQYLCARKVYVDEIECNGVAAPHFRAVYGRVNAGHSIIGFVTDLRLYLSNNSGHECDEELFLNKIQAWLVEKNMRDFNDIEKGLLFHFIRWSSYFEKLENNFNQSVRDPILCTTLISKIDPKVTFGTLDHFGFTVNAPMLPIVQSPIDIHSDRYRDIFIHDDFKGALGSAQTEEDMRSLIQKFIFNSSEEDYKKSVFSGNREMCLEPIDTKQKKYYSEFYSIKDIPKELKQEASSIAGTPDNFMWSECLVLGSWGGMMGVFVQNIEFGIPKCFVAQKEFYDKFKVRLPIFQKNNEGIIPTNSLDMIQGYINEHLCLDVATDAETLATKLSGCINLFTKIRAYICNGAKEHSILVNALFEMSIKLSDSTIIPSLIHSNIFGVTKQEMFEFTDLFTQNMHTLTNQNRTQRFITAVSLIIGLMYVSENDNAPFIKGFIGKLKTPFSSHEEHNVLGKLEHLVDSQETTYPFGNPNKLIDIEFLRSLNSVDPCLTVSVIACVSMRETHSSFLLPEDIWCHEICQKMKEFIQTFQFNANDLTLVPDIIKFLSKVPDSRKRALYSALKPRFYSESKTGEVCMTEKFIQMCLFFLDPLRFLSDYFVTARSTIDDVESYLSLQPDLPKLQFQEDFLTRCFERTFLPNGVKHAQALLKRGDERFREKPNKATSDLAQQLVHFVYNNDRLVPTVGATPEQVKKSAKIVDYIFHLIVLLSTENQGRNYTLLWASHPIFQQ